MKHNNKWGKNPTYIEWDPIGNDVKSKTQAMQINWIVSNMRIVLWIMVSMVSLSSISSVSFLSRNNIAAIINTPPNNTWNTNTLQNLNHEMKKH